MIRVLHVFAPTFGHTFSGDSKLWVSAFQKWTDSQVIHQIAFVEQAKIVDAKTIKEAFGHKNPINSIHLGRRRRAVWAVKLLWFLAYKRRSYDIIHIHTDHWGALLAGPLGNLIGRPCICQIVRMGEDDPTTLVGQSMGSLKLLCFKCYSRIICISEALRQECLRQGLDEDQALLLINSVDLDVFSPCTQDSGKLFIRKSLNLPENEHLILSVGSIIARKGTDLLVEAFLSLANMYPDLWLVLVGPVDLEESVSIDETFVAGLRKKIAGTGLAERVVFTGRIDDEAVLADYYRAADFFVLPTRKEGLPNVLLEAMSAGLPVLVTHLPGSTDLVVQNGKTGLLTPPENVSILTEKLQLLLDHPERGMELGGAAHVYAHQHFSFNVWQEQLVGIYSALVMPEKL